ncbi:hypothetical protein WJX74_008625 [Apatococcus lobatus]|uniref:Uncharacterized protein n=1 Tax=Apatococcus lobatus TaxID=904363 RepID=A0AAW1Q5J5_9CHLO
MASTDVTSAPEVSDAALSAPLEGAAPACTMDPAAQPTGKVPKDRKRKTSSLAKDLPLSKEEPDEDLQPLPEDATGFRKRSKKDGHVPVRSSSIPGMTVGDVRKSVGSQPAPVA